MMQFLKIPYNLINVSKVLFLCSEQNRLQCSSPKVSNNFLCFSDTPLASGQATDYLFVGNIVYTVSLSLFTELFISGTCVGSATEKPLYKAFLYIICFKSLNHIV